MFANSIIRRNQSAVRKQREAKPYQILMNNMRCAHVDICFAYRLFLCYMNSSIVYNSVFFVNYSFYEHACPQHMDIFTCRTCVPVKKGSMILIQVELLLEYTRVLLSIERCIS